MIRRKDTFKTSSDPQGGIAGYFAGRPYYGSDSKERKIQRDSVPDALVGKILLGTLGRSPHTTGLSWRLMGMGLVGTISEKDLGDLVGFAKRHEAVFAEYGEKYGKESGVDRPVMKHADTALREYGKTLSRE